MDDPLPTAKRRKTTAAATTTTTASAAEHEKQPAILDEERRGATAKDDDRTVMHLLRSLPANVVAKYYIYPFAVKVIKNRKELIKAVDDYLDEFSRNGVGEANNDPVHEESWSDEFSEDGGEDTASSDNAEAKEREALSSLLDDRISLDPSNQNSSIEPRFSDDEPQDDRKETAAAASVHSRRVLYPIAHWDVSRVVDCTSVFDEDRNRKSRRFNEDLSQWNVAKGTRFVRKVAGCHVFQSDLSNWNTGRATNLSDMFEDCTSFQSDLSRWNVANATDLGGMFHVATVSIRTFRGGM
jgi:surface protein